MQKSESEKSEATPEKALPDKADSHAEKKQRDQAIAGLNSGLLNKQQQDALADQQGTGKTKVTGFGKNRDGKGGLPSGESIFGDAKNQAALRDVWTGKDQRKQELMKEIMEASAQGKLLSDGGFVASVAKPNADNVEGIVASTFPGIYERDRLPIPARPAPDGTAPGASSNDGDQQDLARIEPAGTKSANTELIAQAQKQKDDPLTKLKNKFEHPGRNNPDAGIDYAAAQDGYNRFDLQKYGVDRALVPSIIRNEQYWLGPKDGIQEWVTADRPFQMPVPKNMTVGPAQMKIEIMEQLAEKFADKLPEFSLPARQAFQVGTLKMGEREADIAMLSQNKKNAALITAAYFANVIERLETGQPACENTSKKNNDHIAELWKTNTPGSRTEALIRSYNPGNGDKHVHNVLNHMKEVKKTHATDL
jgi:hypothetical protein